MSEPIHALEIQALEKVYASGQHALKGLNLSVKQGDFFALLGPNGAGKSTAIGIMCDLVKKSGGTVSIMGMDIDEDFARAKRYLGVVPQEFNFNQFEKVQDILLQQAGYYGITRQDAQGRCAHYLKKLGLWEKRDTVSRMLSGGMKRRLMIARALMHEPQVLILDEPTAGVDVELRRDLWEFLKELNAQGRTIILTTHYLEEAEQLCRNLALIDQGEIIHHGPVSELLKSMQAQSYVVELAFATNKTHLDGFALKLQPNADSSYEITLKGEQSLNHLFEVFSKHQLKVNSIRPATNRLEEWFVTLTEKTLNHNAA